MLAVIAYLVGGMLMPQGTLDADGIQVGINAQIAATYIAWVVGFMAGIGVFAGPIRWAMGQVMSGAATPAQIAGLLVAMRSHGVDTDQAHRKRKGFHRNDFLRFGTGKAAPAPVRQSHRAGGAPEADACGRAHGRRRNAGFSPGIG